MLPFLLPHPHLFTPLPPPTTYTPSPPTSTPTLGTLVCRSSMDVESGPDADTPRPVGVGLLLCMLERGGESVAQALLGLAGRLQVGVAGGLGVLHCLPSHVKSPHTLLPLYPLQLASSISSRPS